MSIWSQSLLTGFGVCTIAFMKDRIKRLFKYCQLDFIRMFNFFERLREERKRLGMNQDIFGSIGGVTLVTQSHYETGKRNPDAPYLAAIAGAGADVMYILTGERTQNQKATLSPDSIADEVLGVMYVVESVLQKERSTPPPQLKAEMVRTAYDMSTPEERKMMVAAMQEGVYTIPVTIAKLFNFKGIKW
ncbi:MAG: helix-turn-helix domain-containing protein [Magnetococcus sp. DMHC-6]